METKVQIREKLLEERQRLNPSECRQMEERVGAVLKETSFLQERGYFYAYYPHRGELSLLKGIQWALDAGKKVALPKVEGKIMDFYEIESLEEVERGSFGVMEPVGKKKVNWEEAVCLTPGVGFDRRGNRIGHGAGYYDRYFAKHTRLLKVGTAYDFQIKDAIPTEERDIRMDWILTPTGCFKTIEDRE